MAIAFQCPKCGGQFSAPNNLAGKKARCQRCDTIVDVPKAEAAKPHARLVPIGMAQHTGAATVQPQAAAKTLGPATSLPAPTTALQPLPGPLPAAAPASPVSRTLRPVAAARRPIPWGCVVGGLAGVMVLALLVGGGFVAVALWRRLSEIDVENLVAANRPNEIDAGPADGSGSSSFSSGTGGNFSTDPGGASSSRPIATPVLPNMPAPRPGSSAFRPAEDEPPPETAPAIPWRAGPDPAPNPVEYKPGKISVELHNNAEIVVPEYPSHFVLVRVSDFRREAWQVLDLRTGKGIGKSILAKLEFNNGSQVFSPDGRYLAATQWGKHDETPIPVWSFAAGDLAQVIVVNGRVNGPLRFAGPHELVTLHDPDFRMSVLTVWDLQSGEKKREIPIPHEGMKFGERFQPKSLAVSPGGKYAALVMGSDLGVMNLATGEAGGRVPLPVKLWSVEAAAFSPDGAELALLVQQSGFHHRLFIIDFATGGIALDRDYRGKLDGFWYDGPTLEWLPDKSGLVYAGHLLLERTTGEEVWVFPETDRTPRRVIRDGDLLVVMRGRGGKVLQTANLDQQQIAKAMEAVRLGGSAIDSALPAITTPDLFSASAVTLPSGPTAWSYTPDGAGAAARGLERDILVAKEGETIRRLAFAGPPAGKLIVHKEVTAKSIAGRRQERKAVIERFDAGSGQKGTTIDLPHVYQLADVSPSGQSVLVAFAQDANRYERLDVVGLSPKKHVAGWRPYANERPEAEAKPASPIARLTGQSDDPRGVVWATMVDDEHVVTVNAAGKLVCWKLPDCQAAYYFEDFGAPLAISGGRKFLAGVHHGEFRVFNALTGECVGDLEAPLLGTRAVRGAFRPDGRELVAIIDAGPDKMLVRWDLTTGKLQHEIPIPPQTVMDYVPFYFSHNGARLGLEYRGKGFVMLDDQYLIDLDKRSVIWKYQLTSGTYAANSPDDQTWYCVKKPGPGDNALFLTSLATPSATVQNKSEDVSLEKQLVLFPGMSVRVSVDLSGVGKSEMNATVERAVAQGLESRGLIVDSAAPHVFLVTAQERSTGREVGIYSGNSPFHYSPFAPRSAPTQTVALNEMVCTMAVKNEGGQTLWQKERAVPMRGFGAVGDNASQQLRDEMAKNFESILASTGSATESLPRYIFAPLDKILAGESQLGFHNEQPPPAVHSGPLTP